MITRTIPILGLALALAWPAAALAQPPARTQALRPTPVAERQAAVPERPAPQPDERLSQTSHTARIGGVEVKYTATAGTLLLKDEAGTPKAQVFFVAYTRDGAAPGRRPITFAYNGGPGSASVWLHMGALGPRRVQMAADGFQPKPPFQLVDNDQSIVDVTDLVMIDAISTGYSRPVPGQDPNQFHGANEDLQWMSEFIRRYLTRFDRWGSPKFLLGESYGTFRSAGLASVLQERCGIELNGIFLVSSVLDFSTIRNNEGNDLPFITYLPTFTATAWYHKRLAPELQADLRQTLEEARAFAGGEYARALFRGGLMTDAERADIARKVSRYTGLSATFVEHANLRIDAARFRKELLRDRRLVTGRLDGRYTAMDEDAAGERQEFDPSNTALQGAYTALFLDYVKGELGYASDETYYTSGPVRPWNYNDFANRYATTAGMLRSAMARNPALKVFVANGYYDMATPFFATEYTFNHLGWERDYQARVAMDYFEGGHMMYTRPPMLAQLKADVAKFITSSMGEPGQ